MTPRRRFLSTVAGAAGALLAGVRTARAATVPRRAGPLRYSIGNSNQTLDQYAGKCVVVEFLLTTCPHCQRVASILDRQYREKAAQGLRVVGLAINDNPDISGFVRQLDITFPVGTVPRDQVNEFLQIPIMVRMMMPQLAWIDRTGMVQSQQGGEDPMFAEPGDEDRIKAAVAKLLGSPAAAAGALKGSSKKKKKP